jgi:hypothetical protein
MYKRPNMGDSLNREDVQHPLQESVTANHPPRDPQSSNSHMVTLVAMIY